ncbi:MAG TPA: LuxR C-terminal-related transcriptional regulator [Candidatus Humimicrobiaceae bacterium]|jgi:PAS domain S-box-containing protein
MDSISFFTEWIYKKNKEGISQPGSEKILNEFEQFFKYIFNSIQEDISILDNDLNILGTNISLEKLFEHKKPLLGQKCYWIYHDRKKPCKNCPTINTIKTGKPSRQIVKYKTPNVSEGWHELFTFPLFDDNSNVTGIIEYLRDITKIKKIELISDKLKKRLNLQSQTLQEQDNALNYLFRQKSKEEKEITDNVLSNINLLIKPYIYDLKCTLEKKEALDILNIIESNINKITESFANKLKSDLYKLNSKEIRIASLIMEGKTSREISIILCISTKAVDFYRSNIRKKLNLKSSDISLKDYLLRL